MATQAEPVDAEIVDPEGTEHRISAPSVALAHREPARLEVAPQVEPAELGRRLEVIKQVMAEQMVKDVDYGVVPGTNTKPTLFKPGAEKLCVLFQLDVQPEVTRIREPNGHLTAEVRAVVFHQLTGLRMGAGEGECSTHESKYAYRNAGLVCPVCGAEAIKKSRPRPDGSGGKGWYCWSKPEKGFHGCGTQFEDDQDERLAGQTAGRVDNPDLPDVWNTVVKMGKKRALVDAVLQTTGASAIFTQDIEDKPDGPLDKTDLDMTSIEQMRTRIRELEAKLARGGAEGGRPHGPEVHVSVKGALGPALTKILADPAVAKRVYKQITANLNVTYMPAAAAAAIVAIAEAIANPVGEPVAPDPDGEDQTAQAEKDLAQRVQSRPEATARPVDTSVTPEISGMEDELLTLWQEAGLSATAALRKVHACRANKRALTASKSEAVKCVEQKARVTA